MDLEQILKSLQKGKISVSKAEKLLSLHSIEKIENIPPEKINYVQTPSPTWGVEQKSKPNLAQTPSPTWGIDQERAEWLHKTRNSPAAKAGMSDDMRWRAHLKNQAFRKEKGRSYSHGDFL